jgi:hypothetical protein
MGVMKSLFAESSRTTKINALYNTEEVKNLFIYLVICNSTVNLFFFNLLLTQSFVPNVFLIREINRERKKLGRIPEET